MFRPPPDSQSQHVSGITVVEQPKLECVSQEKCIPEDCPQEQPHPVRMESHLIKLLMVIENHWQQVCGRACHACEFPHVYLVSAWRAELCFCDVVYSVCKLCAITTYLVTFAPLILHSTRSIYSVLCLKHPEFSEGTFVPTYVPSKACMQEHRELLVFDVEPRWPAC